MRVKLMVACLLSGTLLSACGPVANESGGNEAAGQSAPGNAKAGNEAGTRRFVNSRDRAVTERLRERYLDFSFDYPSDWRLVPQRRDEDQTNFVELEGPRSSGSFLVSTVSFRGEVPDEQMALDALPDLSRQFGETLPRESGHRAYGFARRRIGDADSYGWLWTARARRPGGGTSRVSGRGDIFVPEGSSTGLLVLSMISEDNDQFVEPEEVGESGALGRIYDSFRIGNRSDGEAAETEGRAADN